MMVRAPALLSPGGSHARRPPADRTPRKIPGPPPTSRNPSRRQPARHRGSLDFVEPCAPRPTAVGEGDRDDARLLCDAPRERRERLRPPILERRRGLLLERPIHIDASGEILPAWKLPRGSSHAHRLARALQGDRDADAPSAPPGRPWRRSRRGRTAASLRRCPDSPGSVARAPASTLTAGSMRQHRRADDREATGIQDRRELQPGRHPERCAARGPVGGFRSPRQRPVGGHQADGGRDGREHQGLDEELTRRCARGSRRARSARRFPPRASPSSRRSACRRSCTR